jgi:hypothetical protein
MTGGNHRDGSLVHVAAHIHLNLTIGCPQNKTALLSLTAPPPSATWLKSREINPLKSP